MVAEISRAVSNELQVGGATLTSTGIKFAKGTSIEDWQAAGDFIKRSESGVQWWIGDWLLHGDGRPEWGDKYAAAVEKFGLKYKTLSDFKCVADTYEFPLRNGKLSFNHHRAVASEPPERRTRLLLDAEENDLSVDGLRKRKRELIDAAGEESRCEDYEQPAEKIVHVSQNSGEMEWYTPADILDMARRLFKGGCENGFDGIDLDPASSSIAQETVQAARYYTAEDDGLSQNWNAENVWLNPPYATGLVEKFVSKLCHHYGNGDIKEAILLTNNASETKWFQKATQAATYICSPAGRIKFCKPDGKPGTPLQGQTIFYFGGRSNPDAFPEIFGDIGSITQVVRLATVAA